MIMASDAVFERFTGRPVFAFQLLDRFAIGAVPAYSPARKST